MLCVYYQLKFQIQFEKFDPIWKVSNQIAKPASTAKLPLQSCLSKSIPIKEKEFTMDLATVSLATVLVDLDFGTGCLILDRLDTSQQGNPWLTSI